MVDLRNSQDGRDSRDFILLTREQNSRHTKLNSELFFANKSKQSQFDNEHKSGIGLNHSNRLRPPEMKPRILFVMTRRLGWRTYADQIERTIKTRGDIDYFIINLPNIKIQMLPFKRQNMTSISRLYRQFDIIDGYQWWLGTKVRAAAEAFAPDVVHFGGPYPLGALMRRECSFKVTAALDTTRCAMNRQQGDGKWVDSECKREAALLRHADAIFPWSAWAGNSAVMDYGVSPERVEVVLPSLDPSIFRPHRPREPGSRMRLLFIGNDFVRKGGDLLVSWVRGPLAGRCLLEIVSHDKAVRGLAGPDIVVHNGLPHAELVERVIPNADILVHPTQSDMSAYVVIEAAFGGVPALASAIGGIPELIIDNVTGWTRARDNGEGFVSLLKSLLADPERVAAAGREAQKHAIRTFDANINYGRFFDRLVELAREARPGRQERLSDTPVAQPGGIA